MDGMPVPVFHHIGSGCHMAIRLETKLSVIRHPAGKSLGLCLQHKIVILLQRAGTVSSKGNLSSRQLVLGRMINIYTCHRQCLCRMIMIHFWLYTKGITSPVKIKIVCNKLILSGILPHNICLPFQIIIHQCSLEFLKFCPQAAVDGSPHIREIFPCIDPVTPVIQTKLIIQSIQIILELVSQIFYKLLLYISACSIVVFRLIIQLKTNDTFSVSRHFHQLSYYPLSVIPIHRMGNIHNLSCTVDSRSVFGRCQHIRIGFDHPGGNCIGGSSDNHRNPGFLHGIQHPRHMAEIKHPFLGFTGTPGRLCNPYHINPRRFHHLHIFVQTVIGHIFIIISNSI